MRPRTSPLPVLLMCFVACSNDDDGTGGRVDGGVELTGGDTSSAGANGQGGRGGQGAGGAQVDHIGVGSVGVYSEVHAGPGMPTSTSGAWGDYRLEGTGVLDCHVTEHGACVVSECDDIPRVTRPPVNLSAGVISIAGGQRAITLTPTGVAYPPESSPTEALFLGGETLTFDVEGAGEIPAHNGSVIAPSPITMLDLPAEGAAIDRATPLTVTWTGGSEGQAVLLLGTDERSGGKIVRHVGTLCKFDATEGAGTIPAEVLALMPPTSTNVTAGLGALVLSSQAVIAGDYLVYFEARRWAITPSGELASREVTLE